MSSRSWRRYLAMPAALILILAVTVGAVITASAFAAQSCTPTTVIASGTTYYQCDPTWKSKAHPGLTSPFDIIH